VLAGAPVTTTDLDLLVRRSSLNRDRLLRALAELEATYRDPAGRTLAPSVERLETLHLHLLQTRFGPLDLLTEIGAARSYEDLLPRSYPTKVRGRTIQVLALDAIIETKEQTARPKDLATLPVLRETLRMLRRE
jgi:hypothetical protein